MSDKGIPPTITVTLDSDLVDSCQSGDCVTIWYVMIINFFYNLIQLLNFPFSNFYTVEPLNGDGGHFSLKVYVKL